MSGRVMVGIDGSAGSRRALRWALAEAARRGTAVEAVTVWESPYDFGETVYFPVDEEKMAAAARDRLRTVVADEAGEDPAVPIDQVVVEGDPATVLCTRSAGADLLVVGARGRGGFTGLLLGSVSTKCVHHSRCPVVVVHPGDDEAPAGGGTSR